MKNKALNGGYYAIKGFIYQFDKSLTEVLDNQSTTVEIEQIQDIGVEDYYIQVKYKESQTYAPSKIHKAIVNIIENFTTNRDKKFRLYCFFKDKKPEQVKLTLSDLNAILSSKQSMISDADKQIFLDKFVLEFSDNFENQFNTLITKIKTAFNLANDHEAYAYHAIFRATLLDIATVKNPKKRIVNFEFLSITARDKSKILFHSVYRGYIAKAKYLAYLKKEFFTFKKPNITNVERLFVIDIPDKSKPNLISIARVIHNISNKYFIAYQSPAPYICLVGQISSEINKTKRYLWKTGHKFVDGTHFNGDVFNISDLLIPIHDKYTDQMYKLVSIKQIPKLQCKLKSMEIYSFTTNKRDILGNKLHNIKEFSVDSIEDIMKIIE